MPDTFVPFGPAILSATSHGFTPLQLKPGPSAAGKTAPAANNPAPAQAAAQLAPAQSCASPKVTLQKQGDVVTGIRIQCGCGQVMELNCVY